MIAGLHLVDFVVLLVYLIGTTALGIWAGRGAKSIAEFFMPRRFGITMMIMSAFGAGTASDQAVTVASGTFRNGISGIWYQWSWLVATPFYWLIAPIFRRLRAVTTADVYELRFDRSVAMLFAVIGIANMTVKIGLMLKGTGALVESGTGAQVNEDLAIAVTAGLFVLYGVAGGLAAAIVTDFVQGILTVVFSVILLPFVLSEVGGISGIKETITDPKMLSLVAPGKISLFFILMFGTQALVGIVAQPYIMGVCGAGKTEFEGRVGFMCGNFVKRFCTVAWSLTAIAAVAWYIQTGRDLSAIKPDNVYGDMAQAFLPNAMPGLLGLFMASMLAGVMSSCDCFMISAAALFTQNVYKHLVTGRSESHYLWVGRAVSVLVVAGGIAFAYRVPTVIDALEIWFKIAPMIGIAFWMALFWRRMNGAGAWASSIVVIAVWYITERAWFIDAVASLPVAEPWRLIWIEQGVMEIYEPWQIVWYMGAAVVTGAVASLLTRPVPREKLDLFYALTRTPIYPGEKVLKPCTLPVGVT
ncbi:MAG: sodium:solute symporter family protein, partial [Candidatus Hydrogenedentes bacterium]|nr:sodium:solute symporter family protein [Candidatus Hydrogenedentota bacterium]